MTQYEKLIVSAYTGILMTEMHDFQNFVEKTLGRPVQTIEFANQEIWEALKEKLKPEFMKLCEEEEVVERVTNVPKESPFYGVIMMDNGTKTDYNQNQSTLKPDAELYILTKKAFEKLPTEKLKREIDPMRFATYGIATTVLQGVKEFAELRQFMSNHGIGASDAEFQECFFNVRQDWLKSREQFFNVSVVDDDGFSGRVVAYNSQANMYKVEHDLVDGRLPVADGWYPPERLQFAVENTKSSVQLSNAGGIDSLIATAKAISEQGKGLAEALGSFKEGMEI